MSYFIERRTSFYNPPSPNKQNTSLIIPYISSKWLISSGSCMQKQGLPASFLFIALLIRCISSHVVLWSPQKLVRFSELVAYKSSETE